jgi:HEAT repeat protein
VIEDGSHPPSDAEEEPQEPHPGGTVRRFFVLPLLVVLTALAIFLVFNLVTFERRSAADYLQEVRGGSANRRWQAAFELARLIGRIPPGRQREALAAQTLRVFEGLSPRRREDVPVRRYLVLVLGKLGDRSAVPALLAATADPDPETQLYAIWGLGALGDARALDPVLASSQSQDPGARKMAAYVLGRLGRKEAIPRLEVLLEDPVADVRWNAAIALAQLSDSSGLSVLRGMLDRASLSRQASITSEQAELAMVGALKALALLRDRDSILAIERVARDDPNAAVREAARVSVNTIRAIGPAAHP